MESHWYLYNCDGIQCCKKGSAFAIRSTENIKEVHCPVCGATCKNSIAWVADMDGGGGPNEPILPYVRSVAARVRNDFFKLREETYVASQKIENRLEQIYSFIKANTRKVINDITEE